jgi:hypothetical protein
LHFAPETRNIDASPMLNPSFKFAFYSQMEAEGAVLPNGVPTQKAVYTFYNIYGAFLHDVSKQRR